MSWTKLSDDWTDRADLAQLSFEDRWHYLAMIQLCSRGGILTGEMRMVDARRCSDHPDPAGAITRLVKAELLEVVKVGVKIVQIDDHVPPPSVRNAAELTRIRMRRSRAHKAGDHSLCLPEHCPVTADVTRNPGTGRDGPVTGDAGQSVTSVDASTGEVVSSWRTAKPGSPGEFVDPGYCEHGMTLGGRCRHCPEELAAVRRVS